MLTGRPQELRASSHHVSKQSGDLLEGGWRTNKSREGGGQAKQGQEVAQGPDGLLQQVFNKVERKAYHRMTGIAAVETERVAAHRSTASSSGFVPSACATMLVHCRRKGGGVPIAC